MDLMQRLSKHYKEYTDTDHKIYSYIRNNINEIVNLTINELGDKSDTSAAAVTRFIKKNDYDKYVDFRLDVNKYLMNNDTVNPAKLFSSTTFDQASSSLKDYANLTVNGALSASNEDAIEELIKAMSTSDLIIVHGTGLSALAAESFYQKSLRAGLRVHMVHDVSTAKYIISTHRGQGVYVAISNSGLSKELITMMDFTVQNKFLNVSLTRTGYNPILEESDINIDIGPTMPSTGAINSSIYAQLIIVDLIFLVYASRYGVEDQISSWWI